MVKVNLVPEAEEVLERFAKQLGLSKTALARRAILNFLEDMEDVQIAERSLNEFYASGEKAIPIEEVMRRLGMSDEA